LEDYMKHDMMKLSELREKLTDILEKADDTAERMLDLINNCENPDDLETLDELVDKLAGMALWLAMEKNQLDIERNG